MYVFLEPKNLLSSKDLIIIGFYVI